MVGVDDLSGGFLHNVPPGVRFYVCDLSERKATIRIREVLNRECVDTAFHLAADATEGRSQFHPVSCTYDNYVAHLHLIRACVETHVRRVIVGSSMSVYGKQTPPFSEELERRPEDIYAISKAAMEQSTEILSEVQNFEYFIVRPHNVYGPLQNMADPYRNVIAIWMNAILRKRPFFIYGDGEQKRAFSYISDIIPCLCTLLNCPVDFPKIYNLGAAREYTLNELAQTLLSITEAPPLSLEYLPSRPLEVKHAWSTTKRSEEWLGFRDTVSLWDGLSSMWRWAKKTYPNGVDPKYLDRLELPNENTPITWTQKLY